MSVGGCAALAASAAWGGLERDNLWQAAPIWSLAFVPAASNGDREGNRLLAIVSAVSIAGVVLTSNHDGGAQWGPRFLLVASAPMIVLACWTASRVLTGWRTEPMAAALVVVVLVCGLLTSRLAYREPRGTKKYYARLVHQTADFTRGSTFAMTDVWWVDQILAPLHGTLTILYVDDAQEAVELTARLERAGEKRITLVRSREESNAGPLSAWLAGSCFVPTLTEDVAERQLAYVRADCR